ncbi:MAG: efflux RND transporter periplasmic adaptor subunit [Marinagarivorans sp.]|nr:efflux RND transporter periplasmic adaptor subunit [Marinagarivorans sp.]
MYNTQSRHRFARGLGFFVGIVVVFCVGMVIGIWMKTQGYLNHNELKAENVTDSATVEPKILYWYDPMVPAQHFDQPGKSPFMDMELVPKYAESTASGDAQAGVKINAAMVQNLGMRTAKVQRLPISTRLEATGTLQFNERHQAVLQLRAAGFVDKVWPLAMGDVIEQGQPIAQLQIPEWLDAQNELLSQPAKDNRHRLKTLRARLQLLGMPADVIAKIERTRQPETQMTLIAPFSGVITELPIKTGMALASGATLARINGLETLWLTASIPEALAGYLSPNSLARFYSNNPQEPVLQGELEAILPTINPNNGTLSARIVVNNTAQPRKPGSSGRVELRALSETSGLFVPTEAVIRTGKQAWVMLALANGQFRPVTVTLGQDIDKLTLIVAGLEEGQEVVASGQFLLDSEASLLGLTPITEEPMRNKHNHSEHMQPMQHEQHMQHEQPIGGSHHD